MAEETIKMYYGDEKVIEVKDGYKKGVKRIITEKNGFDVPEWESLINIKKEKTNIDDLRNERGNYVVMRILELVKNLDIRIEEIGFYIQKLISSMEMNERRATLAAFGLAEKSDMRLSNWQEKLDNELKENA